MFNIFTIVTHFSKTSTCQCNLLGWFGLSRLRQSSYRCLACRTCPACRRWHTRQAQSYRPNTGMGNQALVENGRHIPNLPKTFGEIWNDRLLEDRRCRRRVEQFLRAFWNVACANREPRRGIRQICRSSFRSLQKKNQKWKWGKCHLFVRFLHNLFSLPPSLLLWYVL